MHCLIQIPFELQKQVNDKIWRCQRFVFFAGNVSFRNTETGTFFIQEPCQNFTAYGRRDDLISLLTRTNKCVATYKVEEMNQVYKQMPMFVSTLTKKFYLTHSKDRNNILAIKEYKNKLETEVRKLLNGFEREGKRHRV